MDTQRPEQGAAMRVTSWHTRLAQVCLTLRKLSPQLERHKSSGRQKDGIHTTKKGWIGGALP